MKKAFILGIGCLILILSGCSLNTSNTNQGVNQAQLTNEQTGNLTPVNQNQNAEPYTFKVTSFRGSGNLIKTNSIWYFTVRKYDSKRDSWSKEGPFTLKFTDDSICQLSTSNMQSTTIKSVNCTNYNFENPDYNSITIEGTKNNNEVTVSKLTLTEIQ